MKIENEIQQNGFPKIWVKTEVNILFSLAHLQYKNKLFFKSFGISPEQYNVLRILRGSHPNCLTLGKISEKMIDKMSNASRLVDKLEIKQLVSRKLKETDRRQTDICITKQGLALLSEIDKSINEEVATHYKNFSEKELLLFNSLLDRLRED